MAMHAGSGGRRLGGLLPNGLDVQGLGIRRAHRRVTCGAGAHRSGAIQQFELRRAAGGLSAAA